ncbi:PLC-like phosphodiesterase, TIM beta/alpha-barrel-containing domain containing protein [Naviculisporaceae sp. PSN 640]
MMCFKIMPRRDKKEKKKANFFRRKTTFRWGDPSNPNSAWLALFSVSGLGVSANKNWTLCSDTTREQIKRVYDTLSGGDGTLSRERFLAFLQGMQGIAAPDPLLQERYTVQEFHYIWSKNEMAWRAVRKLRANENDLAHPISNYFINSSHNTYLEGNQLSSKSSAEAYRKVLMNGCRCIEIDVWNGSPSRTPSRSPLPEHRRHISSASIVETLGSVKQAIAEKTSRHSRGASVGQPMLSPPLPAESSVTLDAERKSTEHSEDSSDTAKSQYRVEPIVHHHNTMTTTVPFREVCKAIAESAFETNPLPLIVSLEVGADREQQELMVEIMKEEWGDLLLDKPFDSVNPHERQPLLEELKKKILIKVKRLDDSTVDPDRPETVDKVERGRTLAVNSKPPICEKLAKLAIYTHSEHFEDRDSLSTRSPSHIFSLSEDRFTSLVQAKKEICNQFFQHNREFFMRIYPKGLRVDSSNPDPSFHWRRGVQMVAMNWQKTDEGMMLNDAMFADTNGWVLKPSGYLAHDKLDYETLPKRTLNLCITILAGQYLPLPEGGKDSGFFGSDINFRPHVKVELHVEKQNKSSIEYVRETKAAQGNNPDWGKGGESFEFLDVTNVLEQVSFIRFKVEDTSSTTNLRDELSSWACIRLDRLQPGYRWVDLYHPITRAKTPGQLFIRVDKKAR